MCVSGFLKEATEKSGTHFRTRFTKLHVESYQRIFYIQIREINALTFSEFWMLQVIPCSTRSNPGL